MTPMLIYGANGYTGELITRLSVERGMRPLLAGRNEAAVGALAKRFDLPYRVCGLDIPQKLDAVLNEVAMVIHCAGPFSVTWKSMVDACLRTRKHYTDITGEIAVFESCAQTDAKACQAGIMVMPGVGFDVVPSDCLALHLKNRLPSATELWLAFHGIGRLSHGTQATMTKNIGHGGAVRRDGKITPVPAAWKFRNIDFGTGSQSAVTIPWGDVSTAYYSTGIPNIEVYSVMPRSVVQGMKLTRYLGWLLASGPVQKYLQKQIPAGGPSDKQRSEGKSLLWGLARDASGREVESRLQGPEGYTLTALTALLVAEKILAGQFQAGFRTPAQAYGADLIMEIDSVQRQDVR
ncbi:MAG: saccharopine dehydrogenase NADP-binding domain-containing protein [Pirellulaceae bacterium]|nr:saccharopine dehydrogenase NADP-binding domain-containing protein [Pirellulaceae bacterium]